MFLRTDIPLKKNWPLHIMIVVYAGIWIWAAFKPTDRADWVAENIIPVLLVAGLWIGYRRFAFTNLSYLLITLFLILHAIGAHYAYRDSPVDIWSQKVLHLKRGFYDRIVHCAFGLLLAYPILEIVWRVLKLRGIWPYAVTFFVIMACSGLFEIMEMGAVLLADPSQSQDNLGLHGDPMDTQKDMLMTLGGVLVSLGLTAWIRAARR